MRKPPDCELHNISSELKFAVLQKKAVLKCSVNVLKFPSFYFFCFRKMLVIRVGILKMLVRIANSEDPDQTASSEAV